MPHRLLFLATFALCLPATAQSVDTLEVELDPVVVTAERAASTLSSSTASVSVLGARDLRMLPTRAASGLAGLIPGLAVLDFDGMGSAPQAVVRGFYGGGEAEYVVMLLNGRPINNLENGLINWDRIMQDPTTTVEVLRGGASSLYGDAAIGAVVNVRTAAPATRSGRVALGAGGFGERSAAASVTGPGFMARAGYSNTDGFRDHSGRSAFTAQSSWSLFDNATRSVAVSGSFHSREYDSPGPIRSTDAGPTASLAFFQFDGASEQTARASIEADWKGRAGLLRGSLTGESRNQDMVRTLPLSADFADTQERGVQALSFRGAVTLSEVQLPLGDLDNNLTVGADASLGSLDSRYHAMVTGGLDDAYASASGARGPLLSEGTAQRLGAAAYTRLELHASPRLTFTAGGRLDWLADSFDEVAGLSDAADSATHTAFSPKVGVNYRYMASSEQVGSVYVSASRSFKAPTLDQLYDLRAFPVPFPPFSIQIASASLVPQEGTSYEAGLYHFLQMGEGWTARLNASVYTMEMTNEIDFSFETFSNVNIGESRHRGVELGLTGEKAGAGSAFLTYTLQDVTLQTGEHAGNKVKAVPRHAFTVGATAESHGGPHTFTTGVLLRGVADMWVNDANTTSLPNYATLDIRVTWARGRYRVSLDLFNALDQSYESTAYQDPAGSDVLFVYPSAGRSASLGLNLTL